MKKLNPTEQMRVKRFWAKARRYGMRILGAVIIISFITLIAFTIKTLIAPKIVESPSMPIIMEMKTTVTAYNAVEEQTDDTPDMMANGEKPFIGSVACPRHIPFGTQVEIKGEWYKCADRMAKKNDGKFDILMATKNEAVRWGRQELSVYYLASN